ncbi:MAG: endonuclease V, partial [Gammaproteobacteria bacterium]|nr:endonuclease V [Gammaproteobacteria bacterium]
VPVEKGGYAELLDGDEVIGAVLRTRVGVKPIYVSAGYKVDLPAALDVVMACVGKYRLPETTRWADRIASDKTGRFG